MASINLRNYELAVASVLSKCETGQQQQTRDCYCPLPHFPPKISPLPPPPNEDIIVTINSSVPKVAPDKAADIQVQGQTSYTCSDGAARVLKKPTSRLAKKRADKKQRKEAGTHGPPCWPFDILPPAACPRSGGRLSGRRARKKEGQISSMIRCVLAMLADSAFGQPLHVVGAVDEDEASASCGNTARIRIVDFAGGSGHLALPLALLLPRCQVVIVDLKERSLNVAQERANACGHVPNLEIGRAHV